MQQVGGGADLGRALLREAGALAQPLASTAGEPGALAGELRKPDLERRERLARRVMQVASDAPSLLVLGLHSRGREQPQLLLDALAVGEIVNHGEREVVPLESRHERSISAGKVWPVSRRR